MSKVAVKDALSKSLACVFNVQRYSIHDGPGIRTTVFFKGCPLRCSWCSNPESQNARQEVMLRVSLCTRCLKCIEVCPTGALSLVRDELTLAASRCDGCLQCVPVCSPGAIAVSGSFVTGDGLVAEVEKDRLFYDNSGGGVTASGGEPLTQWELVRSLFSECQRRGLHTTLDTCGFAPPEAMEQVLQHTDLVLYDIKHMDAETHEKLTGEDNALVLANAELSASLVRTWIRFPLVPTLNDGRENLEKLAQFAVRIRAEKVSILAYHSLGEAKYHQLGRPYPVSSDMPPDDEQIEHAKRILESCGCPVTVGW